MVIGLQIEKLHTGRGGGIAPPALPDSEKGGLFRVKEKIVHNNYFCFNICSHEVKTDGAL